MNLRDSFKNGGEYIHDTFGENYMPALQYARFLCNHNGVDPSDFPLKIILNPDGKPFVRKTSINDRFFKYLREQDTSIGDIDAKVLEKITEAAHANAKRRHERAVNDLQNTQNMFDRLVGDLSNYGEQIKNKRRDLKGILNVEDDSIKELADSLKSELNRDFWTLIESKDIYGFHPRHLPENVRHNHILLKTPEIILSYDYSTTEKRTINFGEFVAVLNPSSGEIKFAPFKTYPDTDMIGIAQYFPYFSSGSFGHDFKPRSMCFGNESSELARLAGQGDIAGILALSRMVISNYSDDNPYQCMNRTWDYFQGLMGHDEVQKIKWRLKEDVKKNESSNTDLSL